MTAATVPTAAPTKQPPGLPLLFFVEMWERFSYYGMRALLVLFLVDTTSGFGWTKPEATNLYGWYTGLVWLTPIIGGWLADRYLGTARSLTIGGAVIALGHFTLAGDSPAFFYAGLALIVIGTGLFKANVSTLVGQMYGENDPRRDAGFTIFYMGINMGGFLGPIVCGWLAADPRFGWKWGFAAAGVGMALGVATFALLRRRVLGELGMQPSAQKAAELRAAPRAPLTKEERDRIWAICIVSFFVTFFWLAFEQAGSSINFFAQEKTRRTVDGVLGSLLPNHEIPAAWFQSINSFFIITCAPLLAMVWNAMGTRQPSTPAKMAIGLVLVGAGFAVALPGVYQSDHGTLASPWFLVALFLCHSVGELCLSPVGLSFVTKVAPLQFASALMGVWFLANFLANKIGGTVAGTVEAFARGEYGTVLGGQSDFFLLFVVVSLIAALLLFLLVGTLKRLMHGRG